MAGHLLPAIPRAAEKTLMAVIQEAWVSGVSTCRVGETLGRQDRSRHRTGKMGEAVAAFDPGRVTLAHHLARGLKMQRDRGTQGVLGKQ